MNQLLNILSQGNEDFVNVKFVDRKDFYNWDAFLTKTLQYKKVIKDVSKYHCFFYDSNYNGIIRKKITVIEQAIVEEKVNNSANDTTWKLKIQTTFPDLETAPEISEIKQVELFSKWRKLIPDRYQNEICPKPNEDIIVRVKQTKAKKAKERLQLKTNSNLNESSNNQQQTTLL